MATISVSVGELLFQFDNMNQWINRAQRIWKMHGVKSEHTICIDSVGRIVTKGAEFIRADREGTYPISVYLQITDDPAEAVGETA